MPPEVFDAWIAPNIPAYGWLFTSPEDSVEGTEWRDWFACRPLSFWGITGKWSKIEFPYSDEALDEGSQMRTTYIIMDCHYGIRSRTSGYHQTKERF